MTTSLAAHAPKLIAVVLLSLLIAACSAGTAGSTWTFVPPQPTPSGAAGSPGTSSAPASPGTSGAPSSPSGSQAPASPGGSQAPGSPSASGGAGAGTTIELDLTGSLSIQQNGQTVSSLTVKKGDVITFKITNTAGFDHDFFIGTPDQLSNNQTTGLPGLAAFESGTQTFTYTVDDNTANLQFACSLPGHYPLMHGTFNVQP